MSYPLKCPVCEGHGNVPGGFYMSTPGAASTISNVSQERCRACLGTGILWTKEESLSRLF